MPEIILESPIEHDKYTEIATRCYDVPVTNVSRTVIQNNIQLPQSWNIGLIYGPSGSGKSSLLKTFGAIAAPVFDDKPIISNFQNISPEQASELLCAVGLSVVPSWLRPHSKLSNGEQFRANIAKILSENHSPILIDEFTSVVDRNVAKAASYALQKYIRKNNNQCILASCHEDIIPWIQPDWVYNPVEGITHVLPRGSLQRPPIPLKIFRAKYEAWDLFKHHHYLSADLNRATKCFVATWNDNLVAFVGILSFPHPSFKNGWRGTRTVVLPDYQGLGIGTKLSDYFGSLVRARDGRYFSKTTHPAMIAYRLKSPNWKETSHSRQRRKPDNKSMNKRNWSPSTRLCYAFEYIGPKSSLDESSIFWYK